MIRVRKWRHIRRIRVAGYSAGDLKRCLQSPKLALWVLKAEVFIRLYQLSPKLALRFSDWMQLHQSPIAVTTPK